METQVRSPQQVFMHPQRLVVPLFQRPYVWNKENQWEPLWNDVVRVAERVLAKPTEIQQPHFLGAVVFQQVQNPVGTMQERTIIDGQQRLTTLQLLFDALHNQLVTVGATAAALRMETLVLNAEPFCKKPEDRFKVWPTNRDRPAFNEVMEAPNPVDYKKIDLGKERMVEAHQFFNDCASDWLNNEGNDHVEQRAAAIETSVRDLLQIVVIDLNVDENAQEIFETLNARGASLTAADLIKNLIFQRLLEIGTDVESSYQQYWAEFETAFWETEISVGRVLYSRSSIFLNHWLIAQTGEEIVAREVFSRFKRFANESDETMEVLIEKIDRSATVYRSFIERSNNEIESSNRLSLFSYRSSVLESEVIKPLILVLLDPDKETIPENQIEKSCAVLESWMVRRMLLRASTKSYTQFVAELITILTPSKRMVAGDTIEAHLINQRNTESRYWPDDNEIIEGLKVFPAYRRLRRGRVRMVLEAIEDYLRGWKGGEDGFGSERINHSKLAIEHVMPRKWQTHWPKEGGERGALEREALIHTLGNLTLLTSRLNTKISNGPWSGAYGKRHGLETHDVLFLNRDLLKTYDTEWTDSSIRARTEQLTKIILEIWPVPDDYTSGIVSTKTTVRHRIDLSDLISAGYIEPGCLLIPKGNKYAEHVATLLPDGRLDIGGTVYATPSHASRTILGRRSNGWYFFMVNETNKKLLKDLRSEYLDSISADDEHDDD